MNKQKVNTRLFAILIIIMFSMKLMPIITFSFDMDLEDDIIPQASITPAEDDSNPIQINNSVSNGDSGDTTLLAEAEFALEEAVTINNFYYLQAAINEAPTDGTECVIEITSNIYDFGAVIAIPSGKNITLISLNPAEPFVLTKNAAGRHFTINTGGSLTLISVVLDGNENTAGGVTVNSGGNFAVKDNAVIQKCGAANGGGVYVATGGSFSMSGSKIIENISSSPTAATVRGGGIYAEANTTLYITGGEVSNNAAHAISASAAPYSYGGGIYAGNNSKIYIIDSEISNNTATVSSSSASTAYSYGGGICTGINSTININGGKINNNTAASDAAASAYSYGGGIYGGEPSEIVISGNTEIKDNTVSSESTATGNVSAYSYGGGVYGASIVISDNAVVSRNRAAADAFGTNITASAYGGGIFGKYGIDISGNVQITDNTVSYYFTNSNGSTTYANGGGVCGGETSIINIRGCTISNNTASGQSSKNVNVTGESGGHGGGVGTYEYANMSLNNNTSSEINVYDGAVVSNNKARIGAGIYIGGKYSKININGGQIIENKIINGNNSQIYYRGSGVRGGEYVTININGGIISRNSYTDGSSYAGGGIAGGSYSAINVNSGIISQNESGGQGGGINVEDNGTVNVYGGEISNNTAGRRGGGIHGEDNSTINIEIGADARIIKNTALNGGGICGGYGTYNRGGVINIKGGIINNNTASGGSGGGVYGSGSSASGSRINISGGEISDNKASASNRSGGGGVFGGQKSVITVSGGEIINNTAEYKGTSTGDYFGGGGIFGDLESTVKIEKDAVINNNQTIRNSTLNNNYVGGGAIYSYGSSSYLSAVNLTGAIIDNNKAFNGGCIYSYYSNIDVSGSIINKNEAGNNGGGIYGGNSTITISDDSIIRENKAVNGGGIYGSGGSLNFNGAQIINNAANTNGGGIWCGAATLEGTKIANNTAGVNGGGMYSGGIISFADSQITNNTAADGGGVYMSKLSNLTINNVEFDNNKASVGYGWNLSNPPSGSYQSTHTINAATHAGNIKNAVYTTPFANAYSNYDVNYGITGTLYTLMYNANGGIGTASTDIIKYPAGTEVTVSGQGDFYKQNNNFLGWNTQADGSGMAYKEGDIYPIIGDVILYAQWGEITYKVTFDSNDGSAVESYENILYGSSITEPTDPERENYIFDGWYKNETLTIAWDFDVDAVTSDITLYAKWTLEPTEEETTEATTESKIDELTPELETDEFIPEPNIVDQIITEPVIEPTTTEQITDESAADPITTELIIDNPVTELTLNESAPEEASILNPPSEENLSLDVEIPDSLIPLDSTLINPDLNIYEVIDDNDIPMHLQILYDSETDEWIIEEVDYEVPLAGFHETESVFDDVTMSPKTGEIHCIYMVFFGLVSSVTSGFIIVKKKKPACKYDKA